MKKPIDFKIKTKYVLWSLTGICVILIALSLLNPSINSGIKNAVSYVITPVQKGINSMGLWFTDKTDRLKELDQVMKENDELKLKIDELTEENSMLAQNKYELERLRDLLELDNAYPDYDKTAAHIIAKDNGNWFDSFTIDKGTNAGFAVDMNVIANGGLVGIITEVGTNYSKVKSIIFDGYNVSGKSASSSDRCIVEGDLKLIDSGLLRISNISMNSTVKVGDMILTSPISTKYLPGILIGYVTELNNDANDLTKSGYLIPVVDFEHLEEVLVIKELKKTEE